MNHFPTFASNLTNHRSITNISLAMNGSDFMKGAEWGCNFEREAFHKSATKVRL